MTTSRHYTLANGVAIIGAIFSAGITFGATAPAANSWDLFFVAVMVGWACLPYLATVRYCYRARQPKWRHVMSYGLLGYAITDAYIRVRSLHFETGPSGALVVWFLPILSPAIILIIGGVAATVIPATDRASERRP